MRTDVTRAWRQGSVLVVETEKYRFPPGSEVWWDVAPAEATQDPKTQELRRQYEKDRAESQRFYY